MTVTDTPLPGVKVLHPMVHRDERGFFLETYHARRYAECGIDTTFVQDNYSRSTQGTLRGLHLQLGSPQVKLLRVVSGEIFDVAVDVRVGSPTFGKWFGVLLSAANFAQLYVPEGFAHGFAVISETADVEYKCSAFYNAADEIAIRFDDLEIGVAWPVTDPTLSRRDATAPRLAEMIPRLPRFDPR